MRRPIRLTTLLAIALILIAAGPALALPAAARQATPPAGGLPEREAEGLPVADATVRLTFLGCDDGVDPQDEPERCVTPLAAPDTARLVTYPDVVTDVHTVPVDEDGAYAVSVFSGEVIALEGFFPTDYNFFTFDGVDASERWQASVTLASGEVRDVAVYYWNGPEGLIEPGENTVSVTVLGCPEGVDPKADTAACTEPVDAPRGLRVSFGDEAGPLARYPRDVGGTYTFADLPPYTRFSLGTSDPDGTLVTGDAEAITAEGAEIYAVRGETRELTVYVSGRDDGADTGAIRIGFRGCPDGVDPNVDASSCTTVLDAPPAARVVHRGDLLNVAVAEQPRADDGTYVIEDVSPEGYSIVGLDRDGYGSFLLDGVTESGMVGNVIEVRPGETAEVTVYYYTIA